RLVHAHQLVEPAEHDVPRLRHEVAPHSVAGICQPGFEARTRRAEQEPRRFNRVAADNYRPRALFGLLAVSIEVGDAGNALLPIDVDAGDHATVPNLRS